MVNRTHAVYKVNDRSYFAILKREIHALALSGGFSPTRVGEIDIVVAEMVTNLVKHAGGGQVLVKLVETEGRQGIEILSIDDGPGMGDVNHMMTDGISTKKTLGQGLGAMKRLSHVFQVYSQKDWGTIILIRIFDKDPPAVKKLPKIQIHSVVISKPGEQECGDGFFDSCTNHYVKVFLGDGLGHGPDAAKAVIKAGTAFAECPFHEPGEIIRHVNREVKKTRGLVGTVVVFDLHSKKWLMCGVGNILTKIASPTASKNYMSYNGIIGLNVPNTLNAQEVNYEKGQYVIMCSDGLKSRWDASKYPGIVRFDLTILCACLLKDFARHTDDMSVAVCKINL